METRPGDRGGAGDISRESDSGTSKPYRWAGGRGLAVREEGPPMPRTFKLVLLAWPRCSSGPLGCWPAEEALLEGALGTVAKCSAAPPTSPTSGSKDDIGKRPIFC